MTDTIGLYLHIPFCEKKCLYCDFYSSFVSEELLNSYTQALIKEIKQWGGKLNRPIDTIYLGGGTPSLLKERLPLILDAVKASFNICEDAEITIEVNPHSQIEKAFESAKKAGITRISIGAQSGIDNELSVLGRTHAVQDTEKTVALAKSFNFTNISLDIMLGLPDSSIDTLKKSIDFILRMNPEHISAYILKIEENTAFFKKMKELNFPDDDQVCEQYLFMCENFEKVGYEHYEISNFSKPGFESKHNLKYWQNNEYLGIGPSAHSFIDGTRWFYPRDIKAFINGTTPIYDGEGGGRNEFIMLRLRLKKGLNFIEYQKRFCDVLPIAFFEKCRIFANADLLKFTPSNIYLTNKGMLLSNSIITELLECFE